MTVTADITEPPEPSGPPAVSRYEFNLLRLLRYLLGQLPPEQAAPLLYAKLNGPGCLSGTCVRLAEDTLAKGCILFLVRAGGWRRERFLVKSKPKLGRVWERLPLDERTLTFGPLPMSFLMWLTSEKPTDTKEFWNPSAETLTPADELFFFLANDALRAEPDIHKNLCGKAVFRHNPLCRLANPYEVENPAELPLPDFGPSTTGVRAAILECLQPALAARWVRSERAKGQIGDWKRMRQQGDAEFAVLQAFLDAARNAGRQDLARFLLKTVSTVLAPTDLTPGFWTGGLQGPGPGRLAERLETQRAALALPRQVETLQTWDRHARSVSYFDEEYAASQWWKEEWEQARGDAIAANARRVVSQLDPLRTG